MNRLNFAFRCNGRELYKKKGRMFDTAYDGGPLSSANVVAVEAKGQIRRNATAHTLKKTTQAGYTKQVDIHVGKTLSGITVLYGYAIGVGAPLRPAVPCHMHVEETQWSTSPPAANLQPSNAVPSSRQPNTQLALRNFRATARLIGTGGILGAIDAALSGAWNQVGQLRPQQLSLIRWRNREYLVSPPVNPSYELRHFHAAFGIERRALTLYSFGTH